MRACIECGAPAKGTRCTTHTRAKDRQRMASSRAKRRAYDDPAYRAFRARVIATGPRCHLCGQLGSNTVDHVPPLIEGGVDGPHRWKPAHLTCNVVDALEARAR